MNSLHSLRALSYCKHKHALGQPRSLGQASMQRNERSRSSLANYFYFHNTTVIFYHLA